MCGMLPDIFLGLQFFLIRVGVAQNSTTLVVGRAVTGMGVAGTFGGSYIIIDVSLAPEKRPSITSYMGLAYAIASVNGRCKAITESSLLR